MLGKELTSLAQDTTTVDDPIPELLAEEELNDDEIEELEVSKQIFLLQKSSRTSVIEHLCKVTQLNTKCSFYL